MIHPDPDLDKHTPPAARPHPAVSGRSFPVTFPVTPSKRRSRSTPREALVLWEEVDYEMAPAIRWGTEIDLLLTVEGDPPTRARLVVRLSQVRGKPLRLSRAERREVLRVVWWFFPLMAHDVGVRFDGAEVRRILVGAMLNLRDASAGTPAAVVPAE